MKVYSFKDCGCEYTNHDDGIYFCPLHEAAPALLEALDPREVYSWTRERNLS
jgi:hypothetical protein